MFLEPADSHKSRLELIARLLESFKDWEDERSGTRPVESQDGAREDDDWSGPSQPRQP